MGYFVLVNWTVLISINPQSHRIISSSHVGAHSDYRGYHYAQGEAELSQLWLPDGPFATACLTGDWMTKEETVARGFEKGVEKARAHKNPFSREQYLILKRKKNASVVSQLPYPRQRNSYFITTQNRESSLQACEAENKESVSSIEALWRWRANAA